MYGINRRHWEQKIICAIIVTISSDKKPMEMNNSMTLYHPETQRQPQSTNCFYYIRFVVENFFFVFPIFRRHRQQLLKIVNTTTHINIDTRYDRIYVCEYVGGNLHTVCSANQVSFIKQSNVLTRTMSK